jgi:hypothetical protein
MGATAENIETTKNFPGICSLWLLRSMWLKRNYLCFLRFLLFKKGNLSVFRGSCQFCLSRSALGFFEIRVIRG